jgi:hypothetical protein
MKEMREEKEQNPQLGSQCFKEWKCNRLRNQNYRLKGLKIRNKKKIQHQDGKEKKGKEDRDFSNFTNMR